MLKKSLIIATRITLSLFGLILCIGTLYGQYNPGTGTQYPPKHLGQGSRDFGYFFHEVGTAGTYIQYYGTQSVTGSGTAGRITGTSSALPHIKYDYVGGTPIFNFVGATLQNEGINVTTGTLSGYITQTNGTGTGITLAGTSTFPAGVWGSTGNVGIGTTTPEAKLHVPGTTLLGSIGTTTNSQPLVVYNADKQTLRIGRNAAASFDLGIINGSLDDSLTFYGNQSGYDGYIFTGISGEKMRIQSNGNVGIGTTMPSAKLEVSGGNVTFNSDMLKITNTNSELRLTDNNYGLIRPAGEGLRMFTHNSTDLRFGNVTSDGGYASFSPHVTILAGGNVGIGTTDPSSKCTIQTDNSGGLGGSLQLRNNASATNTSGQLQFRTDGGAAEFDAIIEFMRTASAGAPTDIVFYNKSGGVLAERMRIKDTGNVGIGTTTPVVKLDVLGGDVRAQATSGAIRYRLVGGSSQWNLETASTLNRFDIVDAAAGLQRLSIDASGNVGIGTTTPSNILTLPIGSVTDPIADAWTVHCLSDYKDIGTETTEMIQLSANIIIKAIPVSSFTKKPLISDEEAERKPKQKYIDKAKATYELDVKTFGSSTAVAVQDNSYIDELVSSMWQTKPDRLTLIETNRQRLIAEKKALPKFQRKQFGIVAEDAPPEAQVLREDGSLQGIDPYPLISILWANAQKQDEQIALLETQIAALITRVAVLEAAQ